MKLVYMTLSTWVYKVAVYVDQVLFARCPCYTLECILYHRQKGMEQRLETASIVDTTLVEPALFLPA